MSAFKGTPGPWQVVNGTDVFSQLGACNGAGVEASATDGWYIADCSMGETQTDDGEEPIPYHEQVANAQLMAAAPELLGALQYATEQVPELANVPGIASAIAKALGGDREIANRVKDVPIIRWSWLWNPFFRRVE